MRNHQGDNRPQQRAANHGARAMKAAQDDPNQPPPQPPPPPPPPPPPQPAQSCPRCNSTNTKFCYFNNYSQSQPRYFCKSCRRYWTQGGTLRNVPVGGGCRKAKRPKLPPPLAASSAPPPPQPSSANQHGDLRLSRSSAPVLLPSLATSSTTRPSFPSQGLTTGMLTSGGGYHHHLHQTLRAANPLLMNSHNIWPNLYNAGSSSLGSTATGLFSSMGMTQSLTSQANVNATGMGAQFGTGGHMALLQGMNNNFHLRPQVSGTQQATMTPQAQQFVGSQIQQRPLGSWTQGFINNSGAASSASMAPSTSFWGGDNNAVVGDHGVGNQSAAAATSVFNPNQWTNNGSSNQQSFDPSR